MDTPIQSPVEPDQRTASEATNPTSNDAREEVKEEDKLVIRLFFELHEIIVQYLGIAEIISLTRTCTRFQGIYRVAVKSKWDINRRLKHFVKDPKGFRTKMASFDALISGPFAVQYFEDVKWPESQLHVFFPRMDPDVKIFGEYLVHAEEYKPLGPQDRLTRLGPDHYKRKDRNGRKNIYLVGGNKLPLLTIFSSWYTTAPVNIISWNQAYALFPKSTFIDHQSFALGASDLRAAFYERRVSERQISRYGRRGWEILKIKENEDDDRLVPVQRRIGDARTWKIALDIEGVIKSEAPDYVLQHCLFGIVKNTSHYKIQIMPVSSSALKHVYTAPTDSPGQLGKLGIEFWRDIAIPKLSILAKEPILAIHAVDPSHAVPRAGWIIYFTKIAKEQVIWLKNLLFRQVQADQVDVRTEVTLRGRGLHQELRTPAMAPESLEFYDELIPLWYKSIMGSPELP